MRTPQQIVDGYNQRWPERPPLHFAKNWIYGMWMIGNDYRNKSSYYGAYPRGILDRYEAMFRWPPKVLHIFSGSLPADPRYTRIDISQDADISGNAENLSELVDGDWDLIYADPPYTKIDSEKYGTKHPNKKKVIHECFKVLKPGGFLVWLDTSWPMFRKSEFKCIGTIGLIRSTNHRVRGIFIFKKVGDEQTKSPGFVGIRGRK